MTCDDGKCEPGFAKAEDGSCEGALFKIFDFTKSLFNNILAHREFYLTYLQIPIHLCFSAMISHPNSYRGLVYLI